MGDSAADAAASVSTFLNVCPIGATYSARQKNAEHELPEPASWAGEKAAAKVKAKVVVIRKGLKDALKFKRKARK